MQVKLFQSEFWGRVKTRFGWRDFLVTTGEKEVRVFARRLPFGFSFAYIPYGFESVKLLQPCKKELVKEIRSQVKGLLFIRFDLADSFLYTTEEGIDFSKKFRIPSWLKKSSDIQPPDTVILSLSTTEESLLAAMHKKTRYNIKLAEKKGVVVSLADSSELKNWYELYKITAKRDKITIHQFEYYETLFELAQNSDGKVDSRLYLAHHEGELLAGIIVVIYEDQAIYLYGASSNEKRNLMPAYGLQWQAIVDAKKAGAVSYDFFGIPPINDPNHPMYGLYRFKTGFGGEIVHRAGAWDLPVKFFTYKIFRGVERLRLFYFRRLKKRRR